MDVTIKDITVKNYKRFTDVSFDFQNKSTIIFGMNGMGKSTLLSALCYLNRVWINRINPSQSKAFESFDDDHITVGQETLSLSGTLVFENQEYELNRFYRKSKRNSRTKIATYDKKNYDRVVNDFVERFLSSDETDMPIFVYYGTNRSVLDIPLRIRKKHQFDKLSALDHTMENSVDFRSFFEWYRDQESNETSVIRENGDFTYSDKMLKSVQYAIEEMIGNVSGLKIKINPLRMVVTKDDTELRVDLLSDGEKCTLAMLGDLARRLVLANPNAVKPLDGKGIVLIDEIELHMHPKWQRKVLPTLKKLFPNIQFIVTTHSPQVLGEADDSYLIYSISENDDASAVLNRMDGYDSNYILEEYMDTESTNVATKELVSEIYSLADKCKFKDAEEKLDELAIRTGKAKEEYILASGYVLKGKILNDKNNKRG